jgi:hypothetical protein
MEVPRPDLHDEDAGAPSAEEEPPPADQHRREWRADAGGSAASAGNDITDRGGSGGDGGGGDASSEAAIAHLIRQRDSALVAPALAARLPAEHRRRAQSVAHKLLLLRQCRAAPGAHWPNTRTLLVAVGCCWLLLVAVGCCWLLCRCGIFRTVLAIS